MTGIALGKVSAYLTPRRNHCAEIIYSYQRLFEMNTGTKNWLEDAYLCIIVAAVIPAYLHLKSLGRL